MADRALSWLPRGNRDNPRPMLTDISPSFMLSRASSHKSCIRDTRRHTQLLCYLNLGQAIIVIQGMNNQGLFRIAYFAGPV